MITAQGRGLMKCAEPRPENEVRSLPNTDVVLRILSGEATADLPPDGPSYVQLGKHEGRETRMEGGNLAQNDGLSASVDHDVALRNLARQAIGLSGADIERLVREARQRARREQRPLALADLETLLAGSRPVRSPTMRRRIAVHEAGHVLARILLDVGALSLVTIDGVGGAALTAAILDLDDMQTLEGCESYLKVLMAGRAAEQIIYGSTLAGSGGTSSSDLARATQLATAMETSLGFGTRQPLLYRDPDQWQTLLRDDHRLVRRVHARIGSAERHARHLIRRNRDRLDMIVDALMVHGTLEGPQLENLVRRVLHSATARRATRR